MAFDAFLKIEGIPGESSDEKHKGWIEVLGYSHGVSQLATGASRADATVRKERGRCQAQDFTVIKPVDKATTLLAKAACENQAIKEVRLELCRATGGKDKYLEYKMTGVVVSSIRVNKSPQEGGGLPTEEVAFDYAKIAWTYFQLDQRTGLPQGQLEYILDLTQGSAG